MMITVNGRECDSCLFLFFCIAGMNNEIKVFCEMFFLPCLCFFCLILFMASSKSSFS